jgi:hypothetical protein
VLVYSRIRMWDAMLQDCYVTWSVLRVRKAIVYYSRTYEIPFQKNGGIKDLDVVSSGPFAFATSLLRSWVKRTRS